MNADRTFFTPWVHFFSHKVHSTHTIFNTLVTCSYAVINKATNSQGSTHVNYFDFILCETICEDDIIKNTVMCQFGRGEDDRAKGFAEFAAENGFAPEQKTEIHSQTLRAFVKERIEKGDAFPMELFGAYVGQRATIKKGK